MDGTLAGPIPKAARRQGESVDVLLRKRIDSIEWSFTKRDPSPVENLHPYPAKFIGELPRALIAALPIEAGTSVLDPFVGSGTTLTEAQRAGFTSIGIDLNPIACLIAKVRTSETPHHLAKIARDVVRMACAHVPPVDLQIPNVDHWFKPDVQRAIASLAFAVSGTSSESSMDALRLALSSILVRVSNQESDTRYAAITKDVSYELVMTLFQAAAEKLERALLGRDWSLHDAQVIQADTLAVEPSVLKGKIGAVITSPPYPNAYEYWLYHKYRMWWLGFDPIAVKEKEIGARAHFFGKNKHTDVDFVRQMARTFRLIGNVIMDGGFACFVIGRSKIHGKFVDNAEIIQQAAEPHGFARICRIERVINAQRKSFNLSHANIKTESVLVFQKR
jgi:site-specific DNA-methyltransferase (cytosine-N4-specific)